MFVDDRFSGGGYWPERIDPPATGPTPGPYTRLDLDWPWTEHQGRAITATMWLALIFFVCGGVAWNSDASETGFVLMRIAGGFLLVLLFMVFSVINRLYNGAPPD